MSTRTPASPGPGAGRATRSWALGALLVTLVACQKDRPAPKPSSDPPPAPMAAATMAPAMTPAMTPPAAPPMRPPAMAPATAADAGAPRATPKPAAPLAGRDFAAEVQKTFARLFCVDRPVDAPCQALAQVKQRYLKHYKKPMRDWFEGRLAKDLPQTILYPFSGGDFVTAFSAFPDGRRFINFSLEFGGPPAPLEKLKDWQIRKTRQKFTGYLTHKVALGYSLTAKLQKQEDAWLPGVLPLLLASLYIHDAKPTGLRYFRLRPDGKLHYLTAAELAKKAPPRYRLSGGWHSPKYPSHYSHLELRFRLPGDREDRWIRHMGADLSDKGFDKLPGLAPYLRGLGPRVLMVKAAIYLLRDKRFNKIRRAAFDQAPFFLSPAIDSPPPKWLRQQGFTVETHGIFRCYKERPFYAVPWVAEYRKQRPKPLPFRYGYRDCKNGNNLILARRTLAAAKAPRTAPR